MRGLILVALGCYLILQTLRLHEEAITITEVTLDAPDRKKYPLPDDRAGDFFGRDSVLLAQTPEGQAGLRRARDTDKLAVLALVASGACFLLALLCQFRPAPLPPQKEPPCGTAGSS